MAVAAISTMPAQPKRARVLAGLGTCLLLAAGVLSVGVALVSYRYVAELYLKRQRSPQRALP